MGSADSAYPYSLYRDLHCPLGLERALPGTRFTCFFAVCIYTDGYIGLLNLHFCFVLLKVNLTRGMLNCDGLLLALMGMMLIFQCFEQYLVGTSYILIKLVISSYHMW